jgi:hypothetical protein
MAAKTKLEKGLRYNQGKMKWSYVDFKSLEPMVQVLMYGAHKYSTFKDKKGKIIRGIDIPIEEAHKYTLVESGADNWKKGLNPTEILESNMRHLTALINGEEIDPESGLPHAGHMGCNNMFYSYFMRPENKHKIKK